MKILFCSRWFPYPPDNGSKIRVFNLIKALSSRHQVDLISFTSEPVSEDQLLAASQYCRRIYTTPYRPFRPNRLKALLGFFSWKPRSVVDTYSPEMQALVDRASQEMSYDVFIASETDMAPYGLNLPELAKILEDPELTVFYEELTKEQQFIRRLRSRLIWWKYTRYMAYLLRSYQGCSVVSPQEQERILEICPDYPSISVIPNGVDTAYYGPDFNTTPQADTMVYSGAVSFYANFDAVDFFLRDIFPFIQAVKPGARLWVTGKADGVSVDRLSRNGSVTFTGYLEDIRPTIAQSWVNIVPLRVGGGTRLKILESLALGTPVIATSKGAQGLDLEPGRDLLIADEPADFAAAVLRLLQDPELRQQLSETGRRAVQKYDWQIVGQEFCTLVEQVVKQGDGT